MHITFDQLFLDDHWGIVQPFSLTYLNIILFLPCCRWNSQHVSLDKMIVNFFSYFSLCCFLLFDNFMYASWQLCVSPFHNLKKSYMVFQKSNEIGKLCDNNKICRNHSLGLMTKARACKGAGQEGSPRVTFHVPRSVGECEGMNLHTPKWAPTLRLGVPMDSWIFREQFQGSKLIGLKISLYHWKDFET